MDGGLGNDTYIVDNIGDVASETGGGGGIDTVQSSASHTLGANIENLTLLGTASINATGNALANTLLGTNGANVISGLDGNDTIRAAQGNDRVNGGLGSDSLKGGDGSDIFIFDTLLGPTNVDLLVEYSPSADTIWLDQTIFAGLATGALATSAFRAGSAALDADDRIIYDKPTGSIYYDADGNGAGAVVLFAKVPDGTSLTSSDFFIVP
jgi:Ca2+-binding RTX toxin-like protein